MARLKDKYKKGQVMSQKSEDVLKLINKNPISQLKDLVLKTTLSNTDLMHRTATLEKMGLIKRGYLGRDTKYYYTITIKGKEEVKRLDLIKKANI